MFSKTILMLCLFSCMSLAYANSTLPPLMNTVTDKNTTFKHTVYDEKTKGVVSQRLDTSCGGAALSMLLQNQFNITVQEEDVINFVIQKRGDKFDSVNFDDMTEFAERHNLVGMPQFSEFETMVKLSQESKLPFIVRVKGIGAEHAEQQDDKYLYHFVVVKGISNNIVSISDPIPEIGNVKYTVEEFLKMTDFKDGKGKIFFLLPSQNSPLPINKGYIETPKYYPFENRMPNFIRF